METTELNSEMSTLPNNKTHLMSDDIRQLAMAFLQAKNIMGGAKKNAKSNLHKYANLAAVYEAVEEALMSHNIIIWHFAETLSENDILLHTRLIHAPTGQFVQDTRPLKSEKPGNQAMGSANTYMRRYAVLSLCALDAEDDDYSRDRRINERIYEYKEKSQKVAMPAAAEIISKELITKDQLEQLEFELADYPNIAEMILDRLKLQSLADMPKDIFLSSIKRIGELKLAEPKK